MKKIYTKPEIFFESFSLSTNIAGNCAIPVNTPTRGTCGIPDGFFGETIFGATYCDYEASGEQGDSFCYHVPTETNRLFNS